MVKPILGWPILRNKLRAKFAPLISKAIVSVGIEQGPVVLDYVDNAAGGPVVLDYVGNAAEYWMDNYRGDDPEFEIGDGCGTPGLWYVEGEIEIHGGSRNDWCDEHDEAWHNTVSRRLTPEELQAYENGITPFADETRAAMLWHTLEGAAYLKCDLMANWPYLMISFPCTPPETFKGITAACIDIRKPSLKDLQVVMDSFTTWIRMQDEALKTKRILRDEIKKEDPNWESPENLDESTTITIKSRQFR